MGFKEFLLEKNDEKEEQIMGSIFEYFSTHEKPTYKEVEEISKSLGVEKHDLVERIFSLLSSFLNAGEFKKNPVEPDPKELEMGIQVEMEHTTSTAISRRIALDHLAELHDYYTRLKKMENK